MVFDADNYDSSWDGGDVELLNKKFEEWKKRNWETWLNDNLSFPFEVKVIEVDDECFFRSESEDKAFGYDHIIKITGIECVDDFYGVLVKAREGRKTAVVPLCNVEVINKKDVNYWPVCEFNTWFSNR